MYDVTRVNDKLSVNSIFLFLTIQIRLQKYLDFHKQRANIIFWIPEKIRALIVTSLDHSAPLLSSCTILYGLTRLDERLSSNFLFLFLPPSQPSSGGWISDEAILEFGVSYSVRTMLYPPLLLLWYAIYRPVLFNATREQSSASPAGLVGTSHQVDGVAMAGGQRGSRWSEFHCYIA